MKQLLWININGDVVYEMTINTTQTKLNDILIKEMFEQDDLKSLKSLNISNVEQYKEFVYDFIDNQEGKLRFKNVNN